MATRMTVSANYGTHLPCLIKAMSHSTGDVLELGMGVFSTPYLHYQSIISNRKLTSYDNNHGWAQWFIKYGYLHPYHEIIAVDNYDDAKIEKEWDVVLIDHSPIERRTIDSRRLANWAKYLIIHDTSENGEKEHHLSEIYPLFKYKLVYDKDKFQATILSNFISLDNFWE